MTGTSISPRLSLEIRGWVFVRGGRCAVLRCGRLLEWWRSPQNWLVAVDKETCEPHRCGADYWP